MADQIPRSAKGSSDQKSLKTRSKRETLRLKREIEKGLSRELNRVRGIALHEPLEHPALDLRSVDWNDVEEAGFSRPYQLAELSKVPGIRDILFRQ